MRVQDALPNSVEGFGNIQATSSRSSRQEGADTDFGGGW